MVKDVSHKMIENMNKTIVECSICFNMSRKDNNLHESYSNLGSVKPEVILYNYFELSHHTNLHDDIPLSDVEQKNDLSMSLSPNFTPQPSTLRDITEDNLVSPEPPIPST